MNTGPACQSPGGCRQTPCFRLQLNAQHTRLACGAHLGEVARDLSSWARGQGLMAGQVTVLAIDPRQPSDAGRPVVVGSFALPA